MELDTSVERAQLEAAKARKRIAESAYKRIQEAAVTRAVTPSELDKATAQLAQAAAQVDELEAVINRKTLKETSRGKIGLADTHEGQFHLLHRGSAETVRGYLTTPSLARW